jgi:hypothetical protein
MRVRFPSPAPIDNQGFTKKCSNSAVNSKANSVTGRPLGW